MQLRRNARISGARGFRRAESVPPALRRTGCKNEVWQDSCRRLFAFSAAATVSFLCVASWVRQWLHTGRYRRRSRGANWAPWPNFLDRSGGLSREGAERTRRQFTYVESSWRQAHHLLENISLNMSYSPAYALLCMENAPITV